ncbi:MAG: VOC family protein [Deltaproteobacteria bacterium]|nr:VOC family protein [Deltaproteobacteria bacterium]MBW2444597.1 VOC family protein [Deltaproteobacteria bacterium]
MSRGIHHIGVATHDMEATLEFYEDVLGFPAVVCEMIELSVGGVIRHAFFDTGGGELIAFMEANDVPGMSTDFDAGINRGLGTGPGMYHFAFAAADPEDLARKHADLEAKGVKVRGIVDHGWCQSIYFHDPNFLQLEFCCLSGPLDEKRRAGRFDEAWKRLSRR